MVETVTGEREVADGSECGPVEDVTVAVEGGRERVEVYRERERERQKAKPTRDQCVHVPKYKQRTHYKTVHTYRTHQVE